MALVNVAWYPGALSLSGQVTQVPLGPPILSEQIDTASDGTATASPAGAMLVEVVAQAACYMVMGRAAGTADADDILIPANVPRYFGLKGDGWVLDFTAV